MKWVTAVAMLVGCACQAQELWQFGTPNRVYGVYRKVQKTPTYFEEIRIGHIDVKVQDEVMNGVPCKKYTSTAFFSPKPGGPPVPKIRHYVTWVAPDGRIVRVFMQYTAFRKNIAADATFRDDEISIQVTESAKTRSATLFAGSGGPKSFVNPFLELMAEADKHRKKVEFQALECTTGGIVQYKALVVGKWKGDIANKVFEGRVIEVDGPEGKLLLYVSQQGELIQIDLPDGAQVWAQDFDAAPGIKRIGN